jgi:hypothetical protein
MLFLLFSLACQGPLGDRHQLDGTRIAALRVSPPGGSPGTTVDATAVISVDGKLWSDTSPELRWYWVSSSEDVVQALDENAPPNATGAAPRLVIPEDTLRLALIAQIDGQVRRAYIDLEEEPPSMPRLTTIHVEQVQDARLETLAGEELSVDNRLGWTTDGVDTFEPGDIIRFEGIPSSTDEALRTRWSATSPYGTFLELDALRTDWVAGDLVIDDGEVEEKSNAPNGSLSILGLLLNDRGGTDYAIRDVHLGPVSEGFQTLGRWVGTDSPMPNATSLVSGILMADDNSPTGIRLEEAQAVEESALPLEDPYGVEALDCAGVTSKPFDPSWLAEHRCTRAQVIGQPVVMSAQ